MKMACHGRVGGRALCIVCVVVQHIWVASQTQLAHHSNS